MNVEELIGAKTLMSAGERNGMRWNAMERNGTQWNAMERNEMQ